MTTIKTQPVTGECVWTGKDMEQRSAEWLIVLDAAALDDLERALRRVQQAGIPTYQIRREDFPLPSFAPIVARIQNEVENGRGLVMVRGFPVERYSSQEAEIIYWGLGTHIGTGVSQNARGELISHVTDRGLEFGAKQVRGYETQSNLFFHNDHGDMVGLLCLATARSGGTSKLVSSAALYNAVLAQHPEYLEELCRGYHYHMRGEHQPGTSEVTEHRVPVFSHHEGRLSTRLARNAILLGEAHLGHVLNERERAPLDFLDETMDALCMTMDFQPGDMQFISNYSVLHARTEFVDFDEPERKRHLLRLWLNLPVSRPLTDEFATRYGPGSARLGVPPVR